MTCGQPMLGKTMTPTWLAHTRVCLDPKLRRLLGNPAFARSGEETDLEVHREPRRLQATE